jgi:hypothetical protein
LEWKQKLSLDPSGDIGSQLCRIFSQSEDICRAERLLQEKMILLDDLAAQLFPNEGEELAQEALTGLISIGIQARPFAQAFPLLPARHHLFASGIEGQRYNWTKKIPNIGGTLNLVPERVRQPDSATAF